MKKSFRHPLDDFWHGEVWTIKGKYLCLCKENTNR